MKNEMKISFLSVSQNERFARATIGAFVSQLDPTIDELTEIKTVVSEAVTNSIIHGYEGAEDKYITIHCLIDDGVVEVIVKDEGVGIPNIDMAKEPLYTSKPELERSGMGFTIMESFMDSIQIDSLPEKGTSVSMKKHLSKVKSVCN